MDGIEAGSDTRPAIEALVDEEWKAVRLKDTGRRTTSVVDVQGRLSRVADVADAPRLALSEERRSALNRPSDRAGSRRRSRVDRLSPYVAGGAAAREEFRP